ncbi:unnamed protein product, partial [Brassica rapa subsp. trilocularis]
LGKCCDLIFLPFLLLDRRNASLRSPFFDLLSSRPTNLEPSISSLRSPLFDLLPTNRTVEPSISSLRSPLFSTDESRAIDLLSSISSRRFSCLLHRRISTDGSPPTVLHRRFSCLLHRRISSHRSPLFDLLPTVLLSSPPDLFDGSLDRSLNGSPDGSLHGSVDGSPLSSTSYSAIRRWKGEVRLV